MPQVPFYRHDLGQAELDAVAEVFAGPILTTGETVSRFEEAFSRYLGQRCCLGVTSCTGALHLSLLSLGIGPGDEVITTPMTFIASATAILEAGATPVFVDVEADTGNLDASKVEAAITPRTRAILPVHLYGQMCDMRVLRQLADRHGLRLIEDAAHCIEGERDGVKPGQLGDSVCFSFYATKNLTCGEGGAVATNDTHLAESLRLLRLHGMTRTAADRAREGYQHWDMVVLGWKYNMDNIQAALLLPQLGRLAANHRKRQRLAALYRELLQHVEGITLPAAVPGSTHALHLFTVWAPGQRDQLVQHLQSHGVGVMVNYRAMHLLSYFRDHYGFKRGDFPVAEWIGDSTLSLPFYPSLTEGEVEFVVATLKAGLGCSAVRSAA